MRDDEEVCLLTREGAKDLATRHETVVPPWLAHVPPSLLHAGHIKSFVLATGLISPFYDGGGKNARLKKASYEGRIGKKAFIYRENKLAPAIFRGRFLHLPANSIVFVESDLDFRLPEYIALRFNLHIRHVHRGLLLGTGPLVDPGFVGKLCIPLHNLTSEDYEISRDDGLIWIEFTRTTYGHPGAETPSGVEPTNKGFWSIEDFIRKSANGVGGISGIAIQSSIEGALIASKNAAVDARTDAQAAARRVARLTGFLSLAGFVAFSAVLYSAGSLMFDALSLVREQADTHRESIKGVFEEIGDIADRLRVLEAAGQAREGDVGDLRSSVERLVERLDALNDPATEPSTNSPALRDRPDRPPENAESEATRN